MNSNSLSIISEHHLLQEVFICHINIGIVERKNFPTLYINKADFGHTYTLVIALFSVLLQNLDLNVLLAPHKSIFYSAILVGRLVTGLWKSSLSEKFFSDIIMDF